MRSFFRVVALFLCGFCCVIMVSGCFSNRTKKNTNPNQLPTIPVKPHTNNPPPSKQVDTTATTIPPPKPVNPPPVVVKPPVVTPTPPPSKPVQPPVVAPPPVVAEPSMDIAVLLPFSAYYYSPTLAFDSLPDKSVAALEFYEGVLTGIDYWKDQGFTPNVHIYDTQNSAEQASQLLTQAELRQADLIIGPLYNTELKPVAAFAQQQRIPMLSPISPSNQITTNNVYYAAVNPSIETHCAAIYQYAKSDFPTARIVAIGGNKSGEIALSKRFTQMATQANTASSNVFSYTYTDSESIEKYLSATQPNVVVVTSFTELTAVDLLNKLYLLRKKYDITLFGMPTWIDMESLDLQYLAALNFHYTTDFWVNETAAEHQRFKQRFSFKYGIKPTKMAAKGYDLMLYAGQLLRASGGNANSTANSIRQTVGKGIYSQFKFGTVGNTLQPDYLENKYVNIIHYGSDLTPEKVN